MKLNSLPKQILGTKKRVGRGHGSGLGKTSGRGTKGQKARDQIGLSFEGGQLRLIKRLPFRRGVGNPTGEKSQAVNLDSLEKLPRGSRVNVETLIKAGVLKEGESRRRTIKILSRGELSKPLVVELPTSRTAAAKITKAGGKVVENSNTTQ